MVGELEGCGQSLGGTTGLGVVGEGPGRLRPPEVKGAGGACLLERRG